LEEEIDEQMKIEIDEQIKRERNGKRKTDRVFVLLRVECVFIEKIGDRFGY
jgi:hypothetical protein